ncbi:MAG: glycine cleavage system protein GcvH [Romboutsia sp.]|nr:glycine cleavage system protein GcvH [Romboutsia sp.]
MKVIPSLKYTDRHDWIRVEGEFAYMGITDFAQDQLGDILFVEMPEVGDEITSGKEYGIIESSKVASDLISPISGEVVQINERLDDEPEYINEDAYDAWIVKVKLSDLDELDSLISAESYEAELEEC